MIDLDSLDGINIINYNNNSGRDGVSTTTGADSNLIATQQSARRGANIDASGNTTPQTSNDSNSDAYSHIIGTHTINTQIIGQSTSMPSSETNVNTTTTTSNNINTNHKNYDNLLTCMLITANVGTIFEESNLLELWFQQLVSYLTKIKPQLVAIHCQEVGGKNYESSMKHVSNFTDKIIKDPVVVNEYSRIRIFLDENFESLEKFTALGSIYLIHNSVKNVKLYNFKTAQFEVVSGCCIYAGNSTNKTSTDQNNEKQQQQLEQQPEAEHVEKVKFPQNLFPECRWSRKGFMRTRWLFNDNQPLDLVNIHLFHDASNLVAMESTPSPYAQNRQRALKFTLDRISVPLKGTWQSQQQYQQDHPQANKQLEQTQQQELEQYQLSNENSISSNNNNNNNNEVPLFIFGDFNFRLDTSKVIQRITGGIPPVVRRKADSNEILEFIYHRKPSGNTIESLPLLNDQTIGSQQEVFIDNNDDVRSQANKNERDNGEEQVGSSSGVVMTVGKKLFDCKNLDETFRAAKNCEWLQEFDNELDSFKSKLYEFKISFSPSYPFKEDESGGYSYMKTRCPAWCDRILFNAAGYRLIHSNSLNKRAKHPTDDERTIDHIQQSQQQDVDVLYRLMGNSVPMGDHKPVLLYCQLKLSPPTIIDTSNNNSTCDGISESTSM